MKKTVMLKKNYEFKNVLNKGTVYKGKCINIFIKKNNKNINALGIAVSKKTGNSVIRNRIKRLIRENYRHCEMAMSTGNNILILWNNKNKVNEKSFFNIKKDMEDIFKKAKIME